eukprot:gene1714-biopygen1482
MGQKLFPFEEETELRTAVRTALQRQNRESTAVSAQRRDTPPGRARGVRGGPDAADRPQESGDPLPVYRAWPPNNEGGRSRAGQRRPSPPPRAEDIGTRAPSTKQLGLDEGLLYLEIQRMKGDLNPVPLPTNKKHWPLHLKSNTPVDADAVFAMPSTKAETKQFLSDAWRYMRAGTFEGLQTSRTLKSTQLSQSDIDEAVRMGKFERCDESEIRGARLPYGWHGVNVFAVPELKGRRRLITEPLLNASVNRKVIPNVSYPSRLARRQSLRCCKYMLQIDFEAFYDAIPIPQELRNNFVFRKRNAYYRLCTLPTGARWSVAVGQAVTWTIVDIDTPVVIHTMIDNIMIAAKEGRRPSS